MKASLKLKNKRLYLIYYFFTIKSKEYIKLTNPNQNELCQAIYF